MKRVLVTGAAGFLGSHLALHHLNVGDKVIGVDDFCSSQKDSKYFTNLKLSPSFTFIERDICDLGSNSFADDRFDLIYNFACPASPSKYQAMPVKTIMTCVLGTKNMLEIATQHKAVLVHASTSEIYGDPVESPQREDYRGCVNSYGPRACYDEGKRCAEALCWEYRDKCGTDARVIRIFNTYGPGMSLDDGRVITNFVKQALYQEPLTVYGHGQQSRSFCYVSDTIRAVVAMAMLKSNPNTPINVGNPNEFTICELVEKIRPHVRDELRIEHRPLPVDDPQQRCPDITLARTILKWEPRVTLAEGLAAMFSYHSI